MNGGTWRATVYELAKESDSTEHAHMHGTHSHTFKTFHTGRGKVMSGIIEN